MMLQHSRQSVRFGRLLSHESTKSGCVSPLYSLTSLRSRYDWAVSPPQNQDGEIQDPKAVVMLLGWWGARPQQLQKYSEIYHDIQCVTVANVANDVDLLLKRDEMLREHALGGLLKLNESLEEHNSELPVFVHMFSNGGGFVWQHMQRMLVESSQSKAAVGNVGSLDGKQLSRIHGQLRGHIMDSCPAYPTAQLAINAMEASGMVRSPIALESLKYLVALGFGLDFKWHELRGKQHPILKYWDELLDDDAEVAQAFVYSTVDQMTNYEYLEEFIEKRRQGAREISTLRYEDSPHVQHYRNHPDEYKGFVHDFVERNMR